MRTTPSRDIADITLNRWRHGYAMGQHLLFDPDWSGDEYPGVVGRERFGRITIANSDAEGACLTQAAFDQAHRAVDELMPHVAWWNRIWREGLGGSPERALQSLLRAPFRFRSVELELSACAGPSTRAPGVRVASSIVSHISTAAPQGRRRRALSCDGGRPPELQWVSGARRTTPRRGSGSQR